MNIIPYIIDLLNQNGKVEIPGFGTFELQSKPAEIHPIQHTFIAPQTIVTFSPVYKNDMQLVRYIAERENEPEGGAQIAILALVNRTLKALKENGSFVWENFGEFKKNDEKTEFLTTNIELLQVNTFGLPDFTTEAVDRGEFKEQAQKMKTEAELALQRKRRKRLVWIIVILVLLGGIGTCSYFYQIQIAAQYRIAAAHIQKLFSKETQQTEPLATTTTETPQDVLVQAPEGAATPEIQTQTLEQPPIAEPQVQTAAPVEKPAQMPTTVSASGSGYDIIAGSFGLQANAEKLLNKMKSQGFANTYIFQSANGKHYFVSLGSYAGKEEANAALKEYSKKHPSAWVMQRK